MNTAIFPIFCVLVAMASIQTGASVAKSLFPALGASGTTSLRLFFASLILFAFWRPWIGKKPGRREWLSIAAYGTALGSMNLLFYFALARIPLGIAVALEFTGPLCVALFSSRRRLDFLWAFLATIGIVLILPIRAASAPLDPIGVAFALAAGACWALYIITGQKAGSRIPAGTVTSIGMFFATLVALPFGVQHSGAELIQPAHLPVALLMAVLSSALPYSLEMFALKRLPTHTFGILMSLEPAVAALSGLVFLNENLSAQQWGAIFCVMLASFGSAVTATK